MPFRKLNLPRELFCRPMHLSSNIPTTLSPLLPSSFHLLHSPEVPDLHSLLRHHALAITAGHSANPFLAAKLISLYANLHLPNFAVGVFSSAVSQNPNDTFLWNSIIKSHFSNGNFLLSLLFFRQMLAAGAPPDEFTIPMVVSAAAELLLLGIGSSLHGFSIKFRISSRKNVATGSSLMYMYAKCGIIEDAFKVFDEIRQRDVVAWTVLIIGCVRNGKSKLGLHCLAEMCRSSQDGGARPNSRTFDAGLQACANLGALREGMCLHGFLLKTGSGDASSLRSSLLSMYAKCERLTEAVLAFQELTERDDVSFTELLSVYAKNGLLGECLKLLKSIMDSGISPDDVSISCVLSGFANSSSIYGGRAFHAMMLRKNIELTEPVISSLVIMYCKLRQFGIAEALFYDIGKQYAELWNIMICEYEKAGMATECLDLFRKMKFHNLNFNVEVDTLVHVFSSCSELEALRFGLSIHCFVLKQSLLEEPLSNSLLCMYGRCGKLDLARRIFQQTKRSVITWNALMSTCNHLGHSSDALALLSQMISEGLKPDSSTLLIALSACSHVAALELGKWVHGCVREMGLEFDVVLCTALVDMYAKCGHLDGARSLFDSMPERDVISWNVMISAYGIHGDAKNALAIFREMERCGVRPNRVTFLAALSACSHAGLVEEARCLFLRMKHYYSITPKLKHYACMVDVLGRSGNLLEAEEMVLSMPVRPDAGIWGALLGACNICNNVEMGVRVVKEALETDPENDGYYILMSNMYGSDGKWEEVERLRAVMKNKGVRKRAGWSSVEINGEIHVFNVGDQSHPQSKNVIIMAESFHKHLEESCVEGSAEVNCVESFLHFRCKRDN
ncbi:Pentatricopeptide repeat-containing protein [Apostasia shenzhenica]|uniref:Pentatricopeptide repeat-containing protein n=1 Tax=Apostasia shenzhenica TaxID=1088818 RepID=A0A2I0AC79_9ASPA|nr:Pentatricopeptide repeat-containing protein [Apostasia shenzhenica]